jgi:Tol biopolymer transport system component/uncharacterized protein YjdB
MLSACSGGGGDSNGGTSTPATLSSIAVTPDTAAVVKDQNAFFSATGTYSDGTTADITSQATWSSDNNSVATINSSTGVATGVDVGIAAVTASMNSIISTAAPLTVTYRLSLTGITISPTTTSIPKGQSANFTATGTYSDGTSGNVSGSVKWMSSDVNVATLNASGIATTLTQGSTTVSASVNDITSNSATLTVTEPVLAAIVVTPIAASVAIGLTTRFTATGTYTDGSIEDITFLATWISANNSIASINSDNGVATGVAPGSTSITASFNDISAPAVSFTVTQPLTITGISIVPSTTSAPNGQSLTFTAMGNYSDGSSGNISGSVTWVSTNPSVATLNSSGLASTLAQGGTTVTASINGITSNIATLTVTAPMLASLSITPAAINIGVGSTQQFVASGSLTDGTAATLGALTWASSTASVGTINSAGLVTGVGVGSTNISASSGGVTSNTIVLTVAVVPPPILVSSDAVGVVGNDTSGLGWDISSISADGRYAVFSSDANNLVPGDTNQLRDAFYKDLTTGAIKRIYINESDQEGIHYSISADGHHVMFSTLSNNLVDLSFFGNTITSGDINSARDIYVMDMSTGAIQLVSSDTAGLSPKSGGGYNVGSLSSDGRYIVFEGPTSELGLGLRGGILVKDMQNGTVRIVDTNAEGTASNGIAYAPVISADGRYVVFISSGSDLVVGDTNKLYDVFRKDLQTGSIMLVPTSATGIQANASLGYDGQPQISADGRFVVFVSAASNLVTSDTNGYEDIFYKDMQTGEIQLVTVTANGIQDNVACARPSISADGRYVAFYSQSRVFIPSGDPNQNPINIFVKNMQTGELKLASSFPSDADGYYSSSVGQITADGKYVLVQTSYYIPFSGYDPEYGSRQILRVPNPFTTR